MPNQDLAGWKQAFQNQKSGAARRGIGWELTFEQWLEWWGEDIYRRGNGHDKLCMQRVGDTGPYALWNIRKGYPLENMRTCGKGKRYRNSLRAAREIQARIDAAPVDLHDPEEAEQNELGWALNCSTW